MRPCGRAAPASRRLPPGRRSTTAGSFALGRVRHRSALATVRRRAAGARSARASRFAAAARRDSVRARPDRRRAAASGKASSGMSGWREYSGYSSTGRPLIIGPRPVGDVRSGSSRRKPPWSRFNSRSRRCAAIVAVLARPLDAQHFAGEGIDDHPPPIFVDVDLDVARLGKAQGASRSRMERFATCRHALPESLKPWRRRPTGWRTAPER